VSVLDARVTEDIDEGHVDAEFLQLPFNGHSSPQWPAVLRTRKQPRQLVGCSPETLHL